MKRASVSVPPSSFPPAHLTSGVRLVFSGVFASTLMLIPGQVKAKSVIEHCPGAQASWTVGYDIWDLIPLASEQYKTALVYDGPSNVRLSVGFDADVAFTLPTGAQVTVTGEAWDTGCNQWMRVLIGARHYWMHYSQLRLI